ncbi:MULTISPECIES: YbjN domain-containing protein [unclassified Sphingomonas]|uniref:YbjN domain-containing protein n=1 Tax=unclassified Sphingomonas TaxID=196159 RepID=UPI002151BA16|nr:MULTISPECIES: YbjN domain-containing protein [unclassified Sphingomonas]MCR5872065.1 YbjN domain-containing protein [Sphingomonas sp. J344]UUX99650.1 YbjN domain-containing protein [Sphingomonas sp. J315]
MRRVYLAVAMPFFAASATPAMAEDKEPCAAEMVCASNPRSVVEAFREAGLKAKLVLDSEGDPLIESAASGYNFDTFFYGCVETNACDSLQFRVTFIKEPENTVELANKWNARKRFSHMYVTDEGQLIVNFDVTTVGGLNKKNFGDVLATWESVLGELGKFFDEHIPAKPAAKKEG